MYRRLLFCLLLLLPTILQAQMLHGRVFIAGTDSAIAHASVYYNASVTGTQTNSKGEFQLPEKRDHIPLTVSCIGYNSVVLNNYNAATFLKIALTPKAQVLATVNIGDVDYDGMTRYEKEQLFLKEFIGTSVFAQSCTIANIKAVEMHYQMKTRTFTAHCNGAIDIDNKKLGYHISYFLDDFIRSPEQVHFTGNFIYKDNYSPTDEKNIIRNRQKAYEGSRMQFVRALWAGKLKDNAFRIYTPGFKPLNEFEVICTDSGRKFIHLNTGRIIITHNAIDTRVTSLMQTDTNSYIGQSGFYSTGLKWAGGRMSTMRVGDLLPFEYQPTSATDGISDSASIVKNPVKEPPANLSSAERKRQDDIKQVKSIILTRSDALDNSRLIKKWQSPIYYKFYGTLGNKYFDLHLLPKIDHMMAQLAALTGLRIEKAVADSLVNFGLIGGNIEDYRKVLPTEAVTVLTGPDARQTYYLTDNMQFLKLFRKVPSHGDIREYQLWNQLQKLIVQCFGMNINANNNEDSLFDIRIGALPDKIKPSDGKIISLLYNNTIKPGMNEAQVDEVLNRIVAAP